MAVRPVGRAAAHPRRSRRGHARRRGRRVRHRASRIGSGPAGDLPVEILSVLSRQGQRIHVRAAPRRQEAQRMSEIDLEGGRTAAAGDEAACPATSAADLVERPRLTDRSARRRSRTLTIVASAPAGFGKTTLLGRLVVRAPPTRPVDGVAVARCQRQRPGRLLDLRRGRAADGGARRRCASARRCCASAQPTRRRSSRRCSTTSLASPTRSCWCSTTIHVIESVDDPRGGGLSARAPAAPRPPGDRQPRRSSAAAGAPARAGRAARGPGRRPSLHAPTRPPRTSTTRWACISRPTMSTRSKRAPRGGSPRCSSPRSRCRAATTPPGSSPSFAGDDRFVVDYLAEEVLERQPDEVRRFLLETAILDRFTGDAVRRRDRTQAAGRRCSSGSSGRTCSSSRSTTAASGTATTTSSPTCCGRGCSTNSPDRVDELHRRASDWYEAAGDEAEAIAHAMAGTTSSGPPSSIELAAPGPVPDPPGGDRSAVAHGASRRAVPRPAGAEHRAGRLR